MSYMLVPQPTRILADDPDVATVYAMGGGHPFELYATLLATTLPLRTTEMLKWSPWQLVADTVMIWPADSTAGLTAQFDSTLAPLRSSHVCAGGGVGGGLGGNGQRNCNAVSGLTTSSATSMAPPVDAAKPT
jgi:hypothetical protein